MRSIGEPWLTTPPLVLSLLSLKLESLSEDVISSLQDDILTHILSFLPTKQALFTSILSKRWRNLFTMMMHLRFDDLMLKCFNHWGSNGGFPFFRNLVKLSFECKTKMGWKVLWSLINNSPKLETLILKVHMISLFNYSQGTYDESRRLFF
ncbi:putative F-box/LRR-repeat protein At5g25860 [Brassica napus]|uniref:putative F-box/LRR-repeat protein At5g25860 n=1 Tax=Brassica napus TaxID=3708 RepID=UPI00207AF29B|nr:putative F-box/LRR-repeat protein At5g25860 [Brassica napus]